MLVMEQEPSKAILRRASVLVVLSLLKALNSLHEEGSANGVNLQSQTWTTIERVLKWIADMDDDEITKGHAEAVLESLENWRMKQLFTLRTENEDVTLDAAREIRGKLHIEEIE